MKRRLVRWGLAGLTVVLLIGAAAAVSQGDSLISLSYLTRTYIPTVVARGDSINEQKMNQAYQDALSKLETPNNSWNSGLGDYSTDLRQREFGRGDQIVLETGSGFLMVSGQASVSHNGALIDVTQGQTVFSGASLTAGHRYLAGENTSATVTVHSGLVRAGVQGYYNYKDSKEQAAPFVDVTDTSWFQSAVDYAYFNHLFDGVGDDRFDPQSNMTRAMMMTVLFHLAGSPEEERLGATATFTDVPAGQWYASFVSWAADYGVSSGVGDGQFAPNQAVTREQVLVLLYNFATNYMGMTLSERVDITGCQDYSQAAVWSRDALSWAAASGVTSAATSGLLEPGRSATRAEVASMLMNFSQLYLN